MHRDPAIARDRRRGGSTPVGPLSCGGSDEKADPKPTKTTASPTPTTPLQPQGAYGVTYQIQNWEAYARDPVVLAWKNDWHFKSITYAKIDSSEVSGAQAQLSVCLWNPSISFYNKNGKPSGPTSQRWDKRLIGMKQSAGRWVLTSTVLKGACPGGAAK